MRLNAGTVIIALAFIFSITACKKDKLLTSGGIVKFSVDTLTFDTVFTAAGSFTNDIKLYNPQGEKIVVSSIRLENSNDPYFHLNVDGVPGNSVSNIEIAGKDSIHIFATVKIDPTTPNTPFVVQDRLIATLNGKEYAIPIMAYGQNAYYIIDSVLKTQTWKTDRPYVIINNALVDSNETLTIPAGCRIYMHQNSRLYVAGTLKVNGTKKDSVVFQGDRLDRDYFGYEGYPAEWGGIYFFSYSYNSEINYAVLKNCGNTTGIGLPSAIQFAPDLLIDPGVFQLTMRHSIIENSIGYGILSFQGSFKIENCLVNSCGAQALAIVQGGEYEINNCDFVIYGNDKVAHQKEPTLAILNYRDLGNNQSLASDLKVRMRNCVVWGSLEDEALFDKVDQYAYDVTLENCLLKKKDAIPSYVNQLNCIINKNPEFVNVDRWDYHLMTASPMRDAGTNITSITDDLENKPRTDGKTDIGCYEY